MAENPEVPTPHNPVVEAPQPAAPAAPAEDVVTIPKKEFEDIKHKAEVSSQNFERAKKAEEKLADAEAELAILQTNNAASDDPAVVKLQTEIDSIKKGQAETAVKERYPVLKEVWSEFDNFRSDPENKGMNLATAAKAFLTEKGLLDPQRKGLEPAAPGNQRQPSYSGKMTAKEAEALMKTDFKKYRHLVKTGQLQIEG